MKPKDGGAAFPMRPGDHVEGMSLRDYFAGQALQGMAGYFSESAWDDGSEQVILSDRAYQIADAMLKAREESKNA